VDGWGEADWAGRRVAVVGLQRSNAAVVRYLARAGARIEVYDQKTADQLGPFGAQLPADAVLFAGPDYLQRLQERLEGLAAVFVTPGMRKDLPALRAAAACGVPLWTEAAYVLELARRAGRPVVGITGSAGKTTTTSLVGEAVRRWRPGSLVGGNIGVPLLDRLAELPPQAWLVMELSSFQLELARCSPPLACVLNVRPNHLDVHGTYEAYVDAKRRIYRFQDPASGDWAVFGRDDPEANRLAAEAPAGVLHFSARGPVPAGAGVEGGWVRWYPPRPEIGPAAAGGRPVPHPQAAAVLPLSAVALPGPHNLQNVAAAAALCLAAGVPPALFAEVCACFRGVEHRLETVRAWRGTLWVNDSIATSPDRCQAALATFAGRRIVLLAGGYDKGIPFSELGREIARTVERVILFGDPTTAARIAAAIETARAGSPLPRVQRARDLTEAVALAAEGAEPGQVVLLSPACASYDQFTSFEERGRRFKELVAGLPE
jgi:UDP-N-acetylmuramoylalanine--D-glutamate ligase